VSIAARDVGRGRPQLRLVRGSFSPPAEAAAWQRVAAAVVACTHELSRHLLQRRWVRVDEALSERRELLDGMSRMPLDVDGRRCLMSLLQAAKESEQAVHSMMNRAPAAR
jgi:hypothetical protein